MTGFVHSFQSMGAVDGPGIRFVIFLQGCPLRCVYCHNPDTWSTGGTEYSSDDIVAKVIRYRPFFGQDGGVTLSGGEALLQADFAAELFEKLHSHGIHTVLDTSGVGDLKKAKGLLCHTDLVLCDIKFADDEAYRRNCGVALSQVREFLELCEKTTVPVWVRHVVVPNLTDSEEEVSHIIRIAKSYNVVKKIELLPFRKLCSTKYAAMGIPFPLENTPECDTQTIERLKKLIPDKLI